MLKFASLAIISQIVMVAQQLILLPLQTHLWGHETTAVWLGAMALSAVVPISDLGLRSAGFAEIVKDRRAPRFDTLWTVMRAHVAIFGVIAAIALWLFLGARAPEAQGAFLVILAASAVCDALFGLRVVSMEALGQITRSEAIFFGCVATRFAAGATMILVFGAGPLALSVLWLVAGLGALLAQDLSRELRETAPLFGRWRFDELQWGYGQAGWSVSSVLATWGQIHLPVITLTAFAPAPIVSAFVAIRSLYGLLNRSLQQLCRVLSIQYVERMARKGAAQARTFLLATSATWAWVVVGGALAIFSENFWLTGPLFDIQDPAATRLLTLTLGLTAIFAINQVFTLSIARSGDLRTPGVANYIYFAAILATCSSALAMRDYPLLLVGLAASEALLFFVILAMFLRARADGEAAPAARQFAVAQAMWVAAVVGGWFGFQWASSHGFGAHSLASFAAAALAAGLIWLSAGGAFVLVAGIHGIARTMRSAGFDALAVRIGKAGAAEA